LTLTGFHVSIRSFPHVLLSIRLSRFIFAGLIKDYQIFFFSARITRAFCSFSGNILCMSGTRTRGNARRVFGSDIFNDKKGDSPVSIRC